MINSEIINKYINNYPKLNKTIIFKFGKLNGGIGDLTKFFTLLLQLCIENNIKLYYLLTNNEVDNYLKLKYEIMYITADKLSNEHIIHNYNDIFNIQSDIQYIVVPQIFYSIFNYNQIYLSLKDIYYFSNDIIENANKIIKDLTYISVHLRLGDKFLETDKNYVLCKDDIRSFNEEKLYNFFENNKEKQILFCCDNKQYREKIFNKFNCIITNFDIGHTSFINTTNIQYLNTITEFYLLAKSTHIYIASHSGFPIMASKFFNKPLYTIQ